MARIEIESDVTGTVWKIEVEEGASVTEGQTLIILESMKMEIPVAAPTAGIIIELHVKEGDVVMEDQDIATLEVLRAS